MRQDCASELAGLAQQLPPEAVRDRLLPLWQSLAGDVSAWVQAAARRQAGPLLAGVDPQHCPEGALGRWSPQAAPACGGCACICNNKLPPARRRRQPRCGARRPIKHHCPFASPPPWCAALLECFLAAAAGPATLTEACAHYLPAVLANLGVERWPQLRWAGWGGGGRWEAGRGLVEPCCRWGGGPAPQEPQLGVGPTQQQAPALLARLQQLPRTPHPVVCLLPSREALGALCASEYVSVRVALAERLHELLALLGPQRVADDLLPLVQVCGAGLIGTSCAVGPAGLRWHALAGPLRVAGGWAWLRPPGASWQQQFGSPPCAPTAGPAAPPPPPQRLSADPHPAVADALAVNIRALLAALPPPARVSQLAFLSHMHPEDGSSCGQWRMRLLIAEQLAGIAALLERQALAEVLLPATLRLCEDPVAAVREAAAAQLGCMVGGLLADMGSRSGSRGSVGQEQQAGEAQASGGQAQQDGGAEGPAAADGSSAADGSAGRQPAAEQPQQEPQQAAAAEQQPQHEQQPQQPEEEEEDEDELGHVAVQLPGGSAAMVQQIVQHLVELRRSRSHRSRQTYLLFCAALLLPQPAPQAAGQAAEQQPAGAGAAAEGAEPADSPAAAAGEAAHGAAAAQGTAAAAASEEAGTAAASAAWPQLPGAVAQSGIAQGLLEGAVALASDPVPNVRLAVARMLAALRRQQPELAASNPKVGEALAALADDADRDVQTAAAGGC